jgi:ferredoxin
MVGRNAIAFLTRGPGRESEEPSIQPSPERCIACGTCVYLCPTRFIKMEDFDDVRIIWDKVYRAKEHLISGRFYAPIDLIKYAEKTEELDVNCFCDETPFYLKKEITEEKIVRKNKHNHL